MADAASVNVHVINGETWFEIEYCEPGLEGFSLKYGKISLYFYVKDK